MEDVLKSRRLILADKTCVFVRQLRQQYFGGDVSYSCGAFVELGASSKKLRIGTANGVLNIRVNTHNQAISYLEGNRVKRSERNNRRKQHYQPRIEIYEREGVGYSEGVL
jgi:hypothetical protein